jgi:5-hydroxyisourate hydrolase-like protein (transthyretin family)
MTRSARRTLTAATAALSLLLGLVVLATPGQADISNPGAVTFTARGGTFIINKADPDPVPDPPITFNFPNLDGPWACTDGVDNDLDGNVDGADAECAATPVGVTQADDNEALAGYQGQFECNDGKDNNLDGVAPTYIGTFDHSSLNPVNPDTQCGSVTDNTEFFTADPTAAYVPPAFTGSIDAAGNVTITSATFQKKWIHFPTGLASPAIAHARSTFKVANLPITGTADPLTGEVTLNQIDLAIFIEIQGLGNCEIPAGGGGGATPALGSPTLPPTGWFSLTNLTTGTSGTLTGSPYNQTNGRATVVRGDFGMPAALCTSVLAQDSVNDMLNLPSVTGNDATFVLQSNRILTSNPSISGTVTNNAGGAPLAGMKVGLYPSTGSGRIATATTDASGNYAFEDIAAGNYRVKVWDPAGNFFSEWNLNQGTWGAATNIAAAVGPTTDVDFGLDAGAGKIEGRVRDRATANAAPLAGATVTLYDSGGNTVGVTTSGPSGWYSFGSLPAGDYKLKFTHASYFTEWYLDDFLAANADVVNLTGGATETLDGFGKVAYLTPLTTPEISGTVTDEGTTAPISGAVARLYTATGQVASTTTDASGNYAFGGIAKFTDYYVRFEATDYNNEWYNEAGTAFDDCSGQAQPCTPTVTYADPINYSGVGQKTGIDATLYFAGGG